MFMAEKVIMLSNFITIKRDPDPRLILALAPGGALPPQTGACRPPPLADESTREPKEASTMPLGVRCLPRPGLTAPPRLRWSHVKAQESRKRRAQKG